MSHWQKVKIHNKAGDRKQEIEEHFGIKQSISKVIESKVALKSKKKSK